MMNKTIVAQTSSCDTLGIRVVLLGSFFSPSQFLQARRKEQLACQGMPKGAQRYNYPKHDDDDREYLIAD